MATLRTVTVGPTSGTWDYLEEAEANEQGDISAATGSDEYVEFICEDFSDTNAAGFGSGWTTAAANYIEVKPDTGNKHNGTARDVGGSGYAIELAARAMSVSTPCDHFRLTGVVLHNSSTSDANGVLEFTLGSNWPTANDIRITDCIIHDKESAADTTYTIFANKTGLKLTMENTIVYGNHRPIDGRTATVFDMNHCTFYGGSDYGPLCDNTCNTYNCYSGGHTSQDWWTGGSAPTGSGNGSEDTTATTDYTSSTNSLTASNQFTNASLGTSADFRLKSGSGCEGAGTAGISTTDIVGTTRDVSTPDIGAFEFVSSVTGHPNFYQQAS